MSTYLTPNMNLNVPIVGVEPGPAWASDINNCFGSVIGGGIDSHDHSPGKGVQITPAGLNISSDLNFLVNNATGLRSARLSPGTVNGASDLNAIYVNNAGDLFYINGSGSQVRLTNGGSIAGTAGSITGLPSGTASAAYLSGPGTFQFQSATNTPANLDAASIILRNQTVSSHSLTLQAPAAMASDYSIVLPALPGVTNILTMDTSGNIVAGLNVDNASLQNSGTVLSIKAGGVTKPMLAALGQQISASSGAFSVSGVTPTVVTNLSVTITTSGRPVWIGLIPDGTNNQSYFGCGNLSSPKVIAATLQILNGASIIGLPTVATGQAFGTPAVSGSFVPVGSVFTIDVPAAGTYTYSIKAYADSAGSSASVNYAKLIAYEL